MIEVKIKDIYIKHHDVSTYSPWKMMVCKLMGVKPKLKFWIEADIICDDVSELSAGDFIRFSNSYESRIEHVNVKKKGIICSFFVGMPTHKFYLFATSFCVIGRTKGEK